MRFKKRFAVIRRRFWGWLFLKTQRPYYVERFAHESRKLETEIRCLEEKVEYLRKQRDHYREERDKYARFARSLKEQRRTRPLPL